MKKLLFSDEWGQIIEYKRYRDSRTGRLLKDKTRVKQRFKRVETVQYRYVGGKRYGSPIYKLTNTQVIKKTFPGGVSDNNGLISESLRDTNILTQVHKAKYALVNIRARKLDGDIWRHQFRVPGENRESFGAQNQAEELIVAIYWELASEGFRTNYNIDLVKFKWTRPRDARKRKPLTDMQISVTLFK
jgi:hypothetical protein